MRKASLLLAAALGLFLGCDKNGGGSKDPLDCDTEIRYDARKIEGRVDLAKLGIETKTSVEAIREVDGAVERYLSRWKTLCREYNGGVVTREEYRDESTQLRERMERLEAALLLLENASDPAAFEVTLRELYRSLVPQERQKDLQFDFTFMAKPPGAAGFAAVTPNAAVPTGTEAYFSLRTTENAYVYMYQELPSGQVNLMFPRPEMPLANPLPRGTELRIPPGDGKFVLEAEGVGREQIHIVASLEPMAQFQAAVAQPGAQPAQLDCAARLLTYSPGADCGARTFGLVDPGTSAATSMHAATTAGAGSIHQIFTFEHTP